MWSALAPLGALALLPTSPFKNWPPVCLELVAPNSTVLKQSALDEICTRVGLWSQRLDKHKLKALIEAIDRHYAEQGYLLSHVRTAYAHDNGTVVLEVNERRVGDVPVRLRYFMYQKQDRRAELRELAMSGRADKDMNKAMAEHQGEEEEPPELVEGNGRTRAGMVANALKLKKNGLFRLENTRFRKMMRRGPFDRCWINLVPQEDGRVELELAVVEKPSFVLEPGISKSLHLNDWMGDVYFEDKNFLGLNKLVNLKLKKGINRRRKEPCLTFAAEISDNPLKGGVIPSVIINRDPVADDAIREGLGTRFQLPMRYPYHAALDFSGDQITNQTTRTLDEAVTAMGFDVGLSRDHGVARQDVDLFASTGLRFTDTANLHPSAGTSFSRLQLMVTNLRRSLVGKSSLASRHVGFWSSKTTPDYLAYRIGGRFYVRGYDEPDFHPFTTLFGGTTELRVPLSFPWRRSRDSEEDNNPEDMQVLPASSTRPPSPAPARKGLSVEGVGFVDYALASDAPFLGRGFRGSATDYLSVGVGLRIGPVKIDYAVNNRREAKVHMSLVDPTF